MKKICILILTVFLIAGFLKAEFSDRILVKVNDEIILQSELDETVELIKTQYKMLGKNYNESELNSKTLDEMIEQKLIITMARDEKIEVSDDAVNDRVNEFIDSLRNKFSSEEEFESALLKEGISYPDFRLKLESQVRDKLIYDKVKQKKQQEFISKAAVSDEDIRKYYEENKETFKINDEMNLAQIFFDKSKGSPVELKKKAEETVKKLLAGEDFNNLLKTLSQEDGVNGGALGWVDTTQMDKKIRTALSNAKKGKIVGPVETEDGFHILKIIDLKKGKIQELSEIKEKIRVKIIESKIEKMWKEWIDKVRQQAYIEKL
jgi:parvulin-like peptidyl-prolyl isomerase